MTIEEKSKQLKMYLLSGDFPFAMIAFLELIELTTLTTNLHKDLISHLKGRPVQPVVTNG